MRTFRSFIFSFETLQARGLFTLDRLIALSTAVFVFGAAELVARQAIGPTGQYWEYWRKDAADHFLWYRKLAREAIPETVIVGDSTASRNFDPQAFSNSANYSSCFNLGWPANFPLAFEKSTIPLFSEPYNVPVRVILSATPSSFTDHPNVRRFERPILDCAFSRRLNGEWIVSDFVYLARCNASKAFSSSWFTGNKLFREPANCGALLMDGKESESDESSTPDEEDADYPLVQRRIEVIRELAVIAKRRSFNLILVVPPRKSESRQELEERYLAMVREVLSPLGFPILDCRRLEGLTEDHFFDAGHLNSKGAGIFSRKVSDLVTHFSESATRP